MALNPEELARVVYCRCYTTTEAHLLLERGEPNVRLLRLDRHGQFVPDQRLRLFAALSILTNTQIGQARASFVSCF